jgi:hypothetical protein
MSTQSIVDQDEYKLIEDCVTQYFEREHVVFTLSCKCDKDGSVSLTYYSGGGSFSGDLSSRDTYFGTWQLESVDTVNKIATVKFRFNSVKQQGNGIDRESNDISEQTVTYEYGHPNGEQLLNYKDDVLKTTY